MDRAELTVQRRPRSAIGRGTRRLLESSVAAMGPRGSGFEAVRVELTVESLERLLSALPRPQRLSLALGLRLLEWSALLRTGSRLSALRPERAACCLEAWLEAGGLRGLAVQGVRTLVMLAAYQQPESLAALGVDWEGRAKALTQERALLLEKESA